MKNLANRFTIHVGYAPNYKQFGIFIIYVGLLCFKKTVQYFKIYLF